MRKFVVALVAAMVMVMTPNVAQAAPAEPTEYYWQSAKSVAKDIGCKKFKGQKWAGRGEPFLASGVCYLKGKRVNVITHTNMWQQLDWHYAAKDAFGPRFFWAEGWGVTIVAKNGNRTAAVVGAKALGGADVYHG